MFRIMSYKLMRVYFLLSQLKGIKGSSFLKNFRRLPNRLALENTHNSLSEDQHQRLLTLGHSTRLMSSFPMLEDLSALFLALCFSWTTFHSWLSSLIWHRDTLLTKRGKRITSKTSTSSVIFSICFIKLVIFVDFVKDGNQWRRQLNAKRKCWSS